MLAPAVALAVELDLAPRLTPVADGREALGHALAPVPAPEVHDHRLPGRVKGEAVLHGKLAVRVAVVLGIREERAVRLEEVDRRLEPVVELDLQGDRIRLQVHEPVGRVVLGQRLGPAMQVDDADGRAVEPPELGGAHPEATVVVVQAEECPPVTQSEAAQDPVQE